jgi:3,4-dihydroxy 2-butanone 4-phosphate synthase/GTP cyclohydrolase II
MVPLPVAPTPENLRYLTAKRDRLGHRIEGLPEPNGAGHTGPVSGLAEAR